MLIFNVKTVNYCAYNSEVGIKHLQKGISSLQELYGFGKLTLRPEVFNYIIKISAHSLKFLMLLYRDYTFFKFISLLNWYLYGSQYFVDIIVIN